MAAADVRHPLDPLSAEEFSRTAAVLRRDRGVTQTWRFASISLVEPAKDLARSWRPGDPIGRKSLAVVWDRTDHRVFEAVVDLLEDKVESWTHRPGVTPNFTIDEFYDVDAALKRHPEVIATLAARGITDLDLVVVDLWTYGGALMPEQWRDRRLGWADLWLRETPDGNPYAHPVPGIKLIVDVNSLELLQIDTAADLGMQPVDGEYAPARRAALGKGGLRTDLKPLHITQPDGVSFSLDGNEVRWQNWTMRIGFNYREGPVIHQVTYDDHGDVRRIANRMSFAEMVVPYRDTSFDHYRRTAYDIGEWGLGYMTTSLELGCDCLGEIRYLDATLSDSKGEPYVIKNAICLHEEDNAVLWKHVDSHTGAEVRRMRRMVISTHATVANYEYLIYWRFYQDGNIECEVRATGIMVATPFDPERGPPETGTVVDHHTYAPYHQHFLVARLDMDLDGDTNTVYEVDSEAMPVSPDNPYGLAVRTVATPIRRESEAARDFCWERQRGWKVVNSARQNKVGGNPSYKLVPSGSIPPMMDPATVQYLRAPVIGHTLWVTRYHEDERWPAGDYPTQSVTDEGMTKWVADDENLEETDLVLWYVFGIHHITRIEEWPIMSADVVSFWLKPSGFFDQNPALDVPPNDPTCH
ncbi:MAG: primary-amine oxidase [Nocardioides sp.]